MINNTSFFFFALVENERDLPHRQHRREFRFDLSGIPDGEVITGAEFRIYKQFMQEHFDNQTFRVSLYQVLQESTNRSVLFCGRKQMEQAGPKSFTALAPSAVPLLHASIISTSISINAGHVYTDISANY